jgi:hypothetical protein
MCSNSPAWMRVRAPLAHGSSSSSTSRAATVAEAIEGCADQFQEQRLLGPEHPEYVGLRDAGLVRDRVDRRTVKSAIRKLSGGNSY